MLMPTTSGPALEHDRLAQIAAARRSASATASSSPLTRSSRIVNSSPPWRAAMSSARMVAPRRSRDLDEEAVARRVSERVVDDLEVVDVEEQDGDAGPASAGPIQGPIEVLAEEGPVGEPGQRVVEGVVEELRLQPLLFGRVDEQALRDAAAARGLVAHRVRLVVDPDDRAVGGDHPVVGAQRLLGLPVLREGGHGRRPVVGMGQPRPQLRVVEERLGRIAEDGLDLRAHVGEAAAVGDAGSATSM